MGAGPITFSYPNWITLFPELSGVSSAQATLYFGLASMYVRNDGGGPINDPVLLTNLLNLTTAHVAKLLSQQTAGSPETGGQEGPSGTVGRISSATEGSVSVQLDVPPDVMTQGWFWLQTSYGALAWQMLKPFRTFRFVGSTKRRTYNPPARYWGNGGWGI